MILRVVTGLFCFFLFISTASADCQKTFGRTFDSLTTRLASAANDPPSVSAAERNCLIGIAGQMLGVYPVERSALTATTTPSVESVLNTIDGTTPLTSVDHWFDQPGTYEELLGAVLANCGPSIREQTIRNLSAADAARCAVIRLPGTPDKLGTYVAQFESGNADGGYETVSADHEAGGWTYGKYQLASKVGGIEDFIDVVLCRGTSACLHSDYRVIGEALLEAGGVEAAKQATPEFVDTWRTLSETDRRMQQAQESYHVITVWQPMVRLFAEMNIDLNAAPCSLRETALSVKTQHSPRSARRIFEHAASEVGVDNSATFIVEANNYRLGLLGQPNGFYSTYGAQCSGTIGATDEQIRFACSYLDGVRTRWEHERELFSREQFQQAACP